MLSCALAPAAPSAPPLWPRPAQVACVVQSAPYLPGGAVRLLWACPSMGSWFWVPFAAVSAPVRVCLLRSLSSGGNARGAGLLAHGLIFEELLTILHSSHTPCYISSATLEAQILNISSLTTATLVIFRFGAPVVSSHAGGGEAVSRCGHCSGDR